MLPALLVPTLTPPTSKFYGGFDTLRAFKMETVYRDPLGQSLGIGFHGVLWDWILLKHPDPMKLVNMAWGQAVGELEWEYDEIEFLSAYHHALCFLPHAEATAVGERLVAANRRLDLRCSAEGEHMRGPRRRFEFWATHRDSEDDQQTQLWVADGLELAEIQLASYERGIRVGV
jgi:hypothetical protein